MSSIVGCTKARYRPIPNRPHDYIYDPLFTVSDARDHQRYVAEAARRDAEFKICPVLETMFSDLPHKPRARLTLIRPDRVPDFIDKSWEGKQRSLSEQQQRVSDVRGTDRHQFFRRPLVPFLQPVIATTVQFDVDNDSGVEAEAKPYKAPVPSAVLPATRSQGTQTDYRESEAQTLPWSPPYVIKGGESPEVLTLATLSWGNGLPAGIQEVEMIERARIKRAWEALIPSFTDEKSKERAKRIIIAIEEDEWALREKEIQKIHEMRLELARRMFVEIQSSLSDQVTERLSKFWANKQKEKNEKITKIRDKFCRELRKLTLKHEGIQKKYGKKDAIDEHKDFTSELYGPQMRYGEDPKRRHEIIKVKSKFLTNIKGLEILERLPKRKLPSLTSKPLSKRLPYELCIRQTRWTENVLQKLHEDLKAIRAKEKPPKRPLRLVRKTTEVAPKPETPQVEGIPDEDEDRYQAAVFFQKIIRGRSTQTLMYRGRTQCQQLLDEIKSTQALEQAGMDELAKMRQEALAAQRDRYLLSEKVEKVNEVVSRLEGETVSSALTFLSKELWRLQDERRAHAMSLLAERERHRREAGEAGRRQIEERRRREHDEMFRQVRRREAVGRYETIQNFHQNQKVMKVKQDSVDIYLEDIILESLDCVAEEESRKYIRELALKIDQSAREAQIRGDIIEREEMVADMIHHYMLPEVDKRMVREKIRVRQQKYLLAAHESIYNEIKPFESEASDQEENKMIEASHTVLGEVEKEAIIVSETEASDEKEDSKQQTTGERSEASSKTITGEYFHVGTSEENKRSG